MGTRRNSNLIYLVFALDRSLSRPELPLRVGGFRPIEAAMGQQHRVRSKRKRRLAYLERKKVSRRVKRRGTPKTKSKKQAAPAAE